MILDAIVLFALLSFLSDENWSDRYFTLFALVLGIGIFGNGAVGVAANYVSVFIAILAYPIVGTGILWAGADLEPKRAALIMGIFTVYQFAKAAVFISVA